MVIETTRTGIFLLAVLATLVTAPAVALGEVSTTTPVIGKEVDKSTQSHKYPEFNWDRVPLYMHIRKSRRRSSVLICKTQINALIPSTRAILQILEPTTFPIAISGSPL